MTNPIVSIAVSQRVAPTPSVLQKSGAFISQGGSNTSVGTYSLLTKLADLTALLKGALALSTLTWSGGVVTATAAVPHGFTVGDDIPITIAGATPAGYNGTFTGHITSTTAFTYPLAVNPGSETVPGVYTPEDVAELLAMATTFFAQGSAQAVWVLELGADSATDGVATLAAWITANPKVFYSYLVPRYWDANAAYLTFLAGFEATGSKTYFFTTTTLATYGSYTAAMKCVLAMVEAPAYGKWAANALTAIAWAAGVVTASTTAAHGIAVGQWFQISGVTPTGYNGWGQALLGTAGTTLLYARATDPGAETVLGTLVASQYTAAALPATEFSLAAVFWATLNYRPTSTNRVTPLNQAYLVGVTPFPTPGNAAILSTLNTANINVVGTGAEGGISNTLLVGGNVKDARPFNYWYSVDWVQINAQRNVNAALINGANNPANPIYYNQDGINTLQGVVVSTMAQGIGAGLVLNPIRATGLNAADFQQALDADTFGAATLVNADPFASYASENPSDYSAGIYNGFAVDYTPLRGFDSITINITVSDFAQ